jgi:hypothetical protein
MVLPSAEMLNPVFNFNFLKVKDLDNQLILRLALVSKENRPFQCDQMSL